MHADERERLNALAETVIGAAFEVSNVLGAGFLEKVYRNALAAELRQREVPVGTEVPLPVVYQGITVGAYVADLVVDSRLIVELKCSQAIANEHLAQCLNYLKATDNRLGLILNFQKPRIEMKRVVNEF